MGTLNFYTSTIHFLSNHDRISCALTAGQQDFKPMKSSLRPESGNPIRNIRVLSPPTQCCSLIGGVWYVQRLDVPLIIKWRCLLPGVWTYSYGSANQLWCFFELQDHLCISSAWLSLQYRLKRLDIIAWSWRNSHVGSASFGKLWLVRATGMLLFVLTGL
jgi:hypothetical protein